MMDPKVVQVHVLVALYLFPCSSKALKKMELQKSNSLKMIFVKSSVSVIQRRVPVPFVDLVVFEPLAQVAAKYYDVPQKQKLLYFETMKKKVI